MRPSETAACMTAKVVVLDFDRRDSSPWASLVRKAGYEVVTLPKAEAGSG